MTFYGFISRLLLLLLLACAVLFAAARQELILPAFNGEIPDLAQIMTWPEQALPASAGGYTRFARVKVSSAEGYRLEQVYLLVNGQVRGDLAQGELEVRLFDGDILALDCRAYDRELSFAVEPISASLDPAYLLSQLSCAGRVAVLGCAVIAE